MQAGSCDERSMLCNDKVLVLVHEQQGAVVDLASIVLHAKAVRGAFRRIKSGQPCQLGANCMGQILHIACRLSAML